MAVLWFLSCYGVVHVVVDVVARWWSMGGFVVVRWVVNGWFCGGWLSLVGLMLVDCVTACCGMIGD